MERRTETRCRLRLRSGSHRKELRAALRPPPALLTTGTDLRLNLSPDKSTMPRCLWSGPPPAPQAIKVSPKEGKALTSAASDAPAARAAPGGLRVNHGPRFSFQPDARYENLIAPSIPLRWKRRPARSRAPETMVSIPRPSLS